MFVKGWKVHYTGKKKSKEVVIKQVGGASSVVLLKGTESLRDEFR